jgi:GNAT superfamily N-acetyltransferase
VNLRIEEWSPEHQRWQELVQLIANEGQTNWAFNPFFEQFSRHYLVALQDIVPVGFLMFVVWEIGPNDQGHPPIQVKGKILTEAKILAFGVPEIHRRQGVGRLLQEHTLRRARELGCYQVRSVSEHSHSENHRLKLSMGFAVVPMERDEPTLTFVMQLK